MLHLTLRLILRSFIRNISFSLTTLISLIAGITVAVLASIWLNYELQYDSYHPDNKRVYAVMMNEYVDGIIETTEETPVPLFDFLSHDVPSIEAATRFDNTHALLNHNDKSIQRTGAYADSSYFQVFKPQIIAGSREAPLPGNHSIAISSDLAKALFENGTAIGKTIQVNLKTDFEVTAVFEMFPQNSSLHRYHFILPFNAKVRPADEWKSYYVKLYDSKNKTLVEQEINDQFAKFFQNKDATSLLFPLTDWRLHWSFENGKVSGGRIVYLVILGIIAAFILIMACVNYINIATARAAKRAREVGVRKMTGATQSTLIYQFMIENMTTVFVATAISMFLAWMLLPIFNSFAGTPMNFEITDPMLFSTIIGIALLTGLIAGSYPAFLLSSLRPALILRGNLYHMFTGARLRKALVVFQLTLSIILVFCAVVLRKQINYMLQQDVGFDKTNVINVWLDRSQDLPLDQIRSEVLDHSSVVSAGLGGASPMEINGAADATWAEKKEPVSLNGVSAHYEMLTTLKLDILKGRNFSRDYNDSANFIITEQAAKLLGLKNPVGQTIHYNMFGDQEGTIVGVVKDFQNDDIHTTASPVIFTFGPEENLFNLFVRYKDGELDEAVSHVKRIFNKFQHGIPVNYSFLDSDFENQVYPDQMLNKICSAFTTIAMIIACLGLLGLTMFNTERRTKEMGIRKVLGASVIQIVGLFNREFFKPVLISLLLGFPPAYFLMDKFLEGYAFRTNISAELFLTVTSAIITLVLITTGYQSIKSARRSPVESLKREE